MSIVEAEQQAAPVSVTVSVGGKDVTFETGKLAKQADGAVVVRSGDTMVLATAQGRTEAREGADFFPLTIDVEERMYAAGKIPGGFFKREGRPTERAILTSRMIDRPIRPLWPKGYRNEVQCVATVLSADMVTPHDILAINGVSAALMISPMPFLGPIGAVRIGLHRRRARRRPDARGGRGRERARPDRRRHQGGPDDGRGRRRPGARGDAARGARPRPARDRASSARPRRSCRRRPASRSGSTRRVTERARRPPTASEIAAAHRPRRARRGGAVVEEILAREVGALTMQLDRGRTSCASCRRACSLAAILEKQARSPPSRRPCASSSRPTCGRSPRPSRTPRS